MNNKNSNPWIPAPAPALKKIQWFSAVRVLGMLFVLVYHFFKEQLPGGFFGVDIFFTFTGYLITSLAIAEFKKSGGFSLGAYSKRRFVRIAPPLFLSLLFTLPLTLLVSPDFTANIARQASAALGFVSNFFEIRTGGSYEANVLPHLYLHTWALSVEMHFYILWGLICAALALLLRRACKKNAEKAHKSFKTGMFTLSLLAAAGSYLHMQLAYQPGGDNSAAYFSSLSHAFPFFIGSAAAAVIGFGLGPKLQARLSKKSAVPLSATGLAISMLALTYMARRFDFNDPFVYRYGFLIASLLAVCAIFSARALHGARPTKAEPKLLSISADLSYNIYLYHWPLYVLFTALLRDNMLASLAALGGSLLFSLFVFYGVEPLLLPPVPAGKAARVTSYLRRKAASSISVLSLAIAFAVGTVMRGLRRRRRGILAAVTVLLMLASALPVGMVFRRAPMQTGIEDNIYAGSLLQDRDAIVARKGWLDSLNEAPLRFGGDIVAMAQLKENEPVPERLPSIPVLSPMEVSGGVTILGDSICVDARSMLIANIPNCAVDALSSRSLAQGYELMMEMQRKGTLREVLVVALGTNGVDDFADYIRKFIDDLAPGHRLVFVVPFDGRTPDYGRAYRTSVLLRELAPRYDFVTLADWRAVIDTRTDLLGSDTVHLGGQASRQLYVGCIAEAVRASMHGPAKGETT